jgi:hypothetical protein
MALYRDPRRKNVLNILRGSDLQIYWSAQIGALAATSCGSSFPFFLVMTPDNILYYHAVTQRALVHESF